jgi:hypothetical protein
LKIITDDFETKDLLLDFDKYANQLSKLIINSEPKFSIGIFGNWGTGKTTLMKTIENNLNTIINEEIFIWEDIVHDKNNEREKLKGFLKEFYGLKWIDNSNFKTSDPNNLSIEDSNTERKFHTQGTYEDISKHSLHLQLNKTKAILKYEDFSREFDVVEDNKKKKIFFKEKEVLTVWFNTWRYEREEQFALIPLMKTIAYAMSDLPQYKDVKQILLRGIGVIGKDFLRQILLKYVVSEEGMKDLENKICQSWIYYLRLIKTQYILMV